MGLIDWLLIGVLGVAFAPALRSLAEVWSSVDYYSHGFLVPIVALWVARASFHKLGPVARHGDGSVVLGVALAVYALGLVLDSVSLQGLAAVGAIAAAIGTFWGRAGLRTLAFPLGLLLFVVPLPPMLLTPIILKLQLFVSSVAVGLLQLLDISVTRHGNVMELPGGPLFVAEACSGITSIVTLLPLGAVLAWFTLRGPRTRAGLILAVVPIAMLGNMVRVVGTVLAAHTWGFERATGGAAHDLAGLLTFTMECALLIALASGLRDRPRPCGAISESA